VRIYPSRTRDGVACGRLWLAARRYHRAGTAPKTGHPDNRGGQLAGKPSASRPKPNTPWSWPWSWSRLGCWLAATGSGAVGLFICGPSVTVTVTVGRTGMPGYVVLAGACLIVGSAAVGCLPWLARLYYWIKAMALLLEKSETYHQARATLEAINRTPFD
jgi:hypothetical protein